MLEYMTIDSPAKRITIIPKCIESLFETGYNARHTIITTVSGQSFTVEAPYKTVRVDLGLALGCDFGDDEIEDDDFLKKLENIV